MVRSQRAGGCGEPTGMPTPTPALVPPLPPILKPPMPIPTLELGCAWDSVTHVYQ